MPDGIDEVEQLGRELQNYDERDDEVTKTEIHVHPTMPSIHDEDAPDKKLKGAAVALGLGIGTALLTGAAALLHDCLAR